MTVTGSPSSASDNDNIDRNPLEHNDNPTASSSTSRRTALHQQQHGDNDGGSEDGIVAWTAERLSQASYKNLGSPRAVEDRFLCHLLQDDTCRASLQQLLRESSVTSRDYSLTVDVFDLLRADPVLGHFLVRYPATLLPLLEQAIVRAQETLKLQYEQQQSDNDTTIIEGSAVVPLSVKGCGGSTVAAATRVHARLIHLPPDACKRSLQSMMQAQDVGKMVQVTGTVVRTGPIQMYESARTYQCHACQRHFVVHADLEQQHNALIPPEKCPLQSKDSASGSSGGKCQGTKLTVVPGGSVHTDYQEIKIQETSGGWTAAGHIPRSLLIKLQHDLVDACQPGDEVVVVGSLLAQWLAAAGGQQPGTECVVGMVLSAHSLRVLSEKGTSAWKTNSKPGSNNNNSNAVGELDKFRQEFDEYWSRAENLARPIQARDFICKAVCPKLYGLQIVKLALLLTLVGGVSSDAYQKEPRESDNHEQNQHRHLLDFNPDDGDAPEPFRMIPNQDANRNLTQQVVIGGNYYSDTVGTGDDTRAQQDHRKRRLLQQQEREQQQNAAVKTRRRDQSHLLLVGDPGTGKSQFLRFAAALCPRSVLTTGVGTTSAGLTCAAVREAGGNGKEFSLEAGALVLADKGVCCIDEFGCIRDADRTTIHEAMEQQTLSVAKGGIVCKLNCRATIIAVMNPRDCIYDDRASLSANTGLGTPLLSRFDLIFKLMDTSDAERDANVTTYLLNRAIQGANLDASHNDNNDNNDDNPFEAIEEEPWSMDKLRAYIAVIKERFQPVMSDEAATLLERHYEACRAHPNPPLPVTVRFLESLIRLSQAHARVLYRDTVTLQDAVAVVRVMEYTAFAGGGTGTGYEDGGGGGAVYCDPMTSDFSPEADDDFLCYEYRILSRYHMLSCLSDDRRQAALALVGTTVAGAAAASAAWQNMEHPRNAYVLQHQQTTTAAAAVPSITTGVDYGQWTAPPPSQGTHAKQDHYGRYYFSPSLHQTQTPSQEKKRPRRS